MGVDYDGVYFYGLLYNQYGDGYTDDNDCFYGLLYNQYGDGYTDDNDWPEVTKAVLGTTDNDGQQVRQFDDWLAIHLGIPDEIQNWYRSDDSNEERSERLQAYKAELARRSIEAFGVEFDWSYVGYTNFPCWYVHPKGASVIEYRVGRVPMWSSDQIEHWRAACERLRAALPGAGEPGLFFGCKVG